MTDHEPTAGLEVRVPGRHLPNPHDARTIAHGMRLTLTQDADAAGFNKYVPYLRDYIDALLRYADELEQAQNQMVRDASRALDTELGDE